MGLDEQDDGKLVVSPALLGAAGLAVTFTGAALVGTSYVVGSTKNLKEEGVDLALRSRAVPLAARALGISTGAACGAALLAWAAFAASGVQAQSIVALANLRDGLQLLQEQREAVAQEFRKKLQSEDAGNIADGSKHN